MQINELISFVSLVGAMPISKLALYPGCLLHQSLAKNCFSKKKGTIEIVNDPLSSIEKRDIFRELQFCVLPYRFLKSAEVCILPR